MTALVLGGSGFMGRSLVRQLVAVGERVIATSRAAETQPTAQNVTWRSVDLTTFDDWSMLLDGISTVYHLAWSTIPLTAAADPVGDVATNVVGSLRLIEALRDRPATRLVFASSGGTVYGRLRKIPAAEDDPAQPIGAYGISKLAVEHSIRRQAELGHIDAVVLRIGNPYGISQFSRLEFGAVSTFCKKALEDEPIVIYGDGSVVRDYLHVDDAVDALLLAAQTRSLYRTFNIGSGSGRTLTDIVAAIERTLGRRLKVRHEPARPFDIPVSVLDVARAKAELGWRPKISLEDGIARMLASGGRSKAEP
jgi:UDP-glucose 4-epimerase